MLSIFKNASVVSGVNVLWEYFMCVAACSERCGVIEMRAGELV